MIDTDRAAHLTDKLLEIIAPELNCEPRTPDNVWCVIEAVACVVAGLIKEPVAQRYYGRALDHYSRDLAARAGVNFFCTMQEPRRPAGLRDLARRHPGFIALAVVTGAWIISPAKRASHGG